MVNAIGSYSMSGIEALQLARQSMQAGNSPPPSGVTKPITAGMQKMQGFQNGTENISKEDLEYIQAEMESQGLTPPEEITSILKSYDQIDINDDGISKEELTAFSETNGMEIKMLSGHKALTPKQQALHNAYASSDTQDSSYNFTIRA